MAKRFSVSGFAAAASATQSSGSVSIVIADSAIAAPLVAPKPECGNGAARTTVTSRAWKDGWIIVTGNGSIAAGSREHA
jgi:hypothetical protein